MDVTAAGLLSLRAAADRAGVHYQTAYRWVRDGRLPASMVDGSYRVATPALDAFLAAKAQPVSPRPPSSPRVERQAASVLDALLAGDEQTVRRVGRSLVDEGLSLIELIEDVIAPPLRTIGEMWGAGDVPVSVEHRASAIVERLLGTVAPNPRGRRRGTLCVAAVAGDRHALPTTMAAVVLRERNWNVHHLGADLPVASLLDFCCSHDLDGVVLSSTTPHSVADVEFAAVELRERGIPTIVGFPGASLSELCRRVDDALS